jgi:hypothetical protein
VKEWKAFCTANLDEHWLAVPLGAGENAEAIIPHLEALLTRA